ncbi:MAG: TIGR02217 family protein [Rhizobiaceae bacterium]|nr:TIGR02217 family protein [Rhizobiaceae bacterium]
MASTPDFHDIRFPVDVALGSSGGPERSTEIVTLGSGFEQRNQRWAHSRRRFDAGYGVKNLDKLQEVIAFYEARRGPLCGFRFRDRTDDKSCAASQTPSHTDQNIGTGDGSETQFQLIKNYGAGSDIYARPITHPVDNTVLVALDEAVKTPDTDYTVDHCTGIISFNVPPAASSLITAGFEFDVPVRFEADHMVINLTAFSAGDVPSIPLIEIRI